MEKEKLSWLAGIFEGEGTTGLYRTYRHTEVGNFNKWKILTYFHIINTDPLLIEKIQEIVNELGINMAICEEKKGEGHLNCYRIVTKKMLETYILLKSIYPFLVGQKRAISAITMKFIESRNFGKPPMGPGTGYSETDERLYQVCKQLNQRGEDKKRVESSETIRQTLKELLGDDIVRTLWKHKDNTNL